MNFAKAKIEQIPLTSISNKFDVRTKLDEDRVLQFMGDRINDNDKQCLFDTTFQKVYWTHLHKCFTDAQNEFKKPQAGPIIITSKTAVGYDRRASMIPNIYRKILSTDPNVKFNEVEREVLKPYLELRDQILSMTQYKPVSLAA